MSKKKIADLAWTFPEPPEYKREGTFAIMELPPELTVKIIGYLSYDTVAQLRVVSRTFNRICSESLNRGFAQAERFHNQCLKRVKSQLPRRESERRTHPLARHCETLSAIETRLSLLSMTYTRYIEAKLCCFIPGKVIDEIFRVLRFIQSNPQPPRIAELLQELRDISSMAMEFFEERIVPNLKSKMQSNNALICRTPIGYAAFNARSMLALPPPATSSYSTPPTLSSSPILTSPVSSPEATHPFAVEFKGIRLQISRLNNCLNDSRKTIKDLEKQVRELNQSHKDLQAELSELRKNASYSNEIVVNESGLSQNSSNDLIEDGPTSPKKRRTSNRSSAKQGTRINIHIIPAGSTKTAAKPVQSKVATPQKKSRERPSKAVQEAAKVQTTSVGVRRSTRNSNRIK